MPIWEKGMYDEKYRQHEVVDVMAGPLTFASDGRPCTFTNLSFSFAGPMNI